MTATAARASNSRADPGGRCAAAVSVTGASAGGSADLDARVVLAERDVVGHVLAVGEEGTGDAHLPGVALLVDPDGGLVGRAGVGARDDLLHRIARKRAGVGGEDLVAAALLRTLLQAVHLGEQGRQPVVGVD